MLTYLKYAALRCAAFRAHCTILRKSCRFIGAIVPVSGWGYTIHMQYKDTIQLRPAKKRKRGGLATLVVLLVLSGGLFYAYQNQRAILDWIALRNYTPPTEIAQLATSTSMTDPAKRAFYVNEPRLEERSGFNQFCPDNGGEQTIVLGCYYSDQAGIYIFKVDDPRLKGVEQVTAAHEMLHAAYDRLSDDERERINKLLTDFYTNNLTDARTKEVIDSYRLTEPNDLANEMHSIFATELGTLTPDLEAYYERYFTNRQMVVAYANAYKSEFISRRNQIAAYDAQLAGLKKQINQQKQQLETTAAQLEAQRRQLNSLAASGNTDEFNERVDAYNRSVAAYNAGVRELRDKIAQHNQIVDRRNAIALEEQELSEALNSSLTTKSTE